MNLDTKKILKTYRYMTAPDWIEKGFRKLREFIFGVDLSIFDKTVSWYRDTKNTNLSRKDALKKALNKKHHKDVWFNKERDNVEKILDFYSEVDIYPFRQPFNKRFGGFRWLIRLVEHKKNPVILEYGCGSAVLTEYLEKKFSYCEFDVADIPSTTLDFIKWKKNKYGNKYNILTIGLGDEGIPLQRNYDLIICKDVLEHTPNPLAITKSFCDHLSPNGILVTDFLKSAEGENLKQSFDQRENVKKYLEENLIPLKKIDEKGKNDGLYIKAS